MEKELQIGERFTPADYFDQNNSLFIPDVISDFPNMQPSTKFVWATLLRHSDSDGIATIAQSEISKSLSISRRTVGSSLDHLKQLNLIESVKSIGQRVASYRVLPVSQQTDRAI